jgi:hypothetical protein
MMTMLCYDDDNSGKCQYFCLPTLQKLPSIKIHMNKSCNIVYHFIIFLIKSGCNNLFILVVKMRLRLMLLEKTTKNIKCLHESEMLNLNIRILLKYMEYNRNF